MKDFQNGAISKKKPQIKFCHFTNIKYVKKENYNEHNR